MKIYEAIRIAVAHLEENTLMYRDEYKLTASKINSEWVVWFQFLPETPGLDVTVTVSDDGTVSVSSGI